MSRRVGQGTRCALVLALGLVMACAACGKAGPHAPVGATGASRSAPSTPHAAPPAPAKRGLPDPARETEARSSVQTPRVLSARVLPAADGASAIRAGRQQIARAIRTPTRLAPLPPAEVVVAGQTPEVPDVYSLSPYARLLAQPRGPHMLPPRRPEALSGTRSGSAATPATGGADYATWAQLAREAQDIFGVDAALVLAVIRAESSFNHAAVSPAGAQGAMQVMPATQIALGLVDPFDPRANVYAGTQYLRELLQRFGSPELALAAYNAGPGAVGKYGGIPPFAETREFVRRVMHWWGEYAN